MTALIMLPFIFAIAEDVLPLPMETPPFEHRGDAQDGDTPFLELLWSTPNRVTDYEDWFDGLPGEWPGATFHNGGVNDAIRGDLPPSGIADVLYTPGSGVFYLYEIINSTDCVIALYGNPPNRFGIVLDPRILVLLNKGTFKTTEVLDFLTYTHDPGEIPEEGPDFTFQALKWAEAVDGVLYVSNAHRTYAESSGGSNGYITAIDLSTLSILWRSRSLVSNSENFLLLDDVIVTGYGFTDEDDFVYVLDRNTGEVLQTLPVPSAPDYFFMDGDTLYVRCYDTDCAFRAFR